MCEGSDMQAHLNICWELQSLNDAIVYFRCYWRITGCRKGKNQTWETDITTPCSTQLITCLILSGTYQLFWGSCALVRLYICYSDNKDTLLCAAQIRMTVYRW